MEKLKRSYEIAQKTLATLSEALTLLEEKNVPYQHYLSFCDSAIQRFEYSIDNFWKYLKSYLIEHLSIPADYSSPKVIIREAYNANIISDDELESLIKAITRRNETSHAYNKELAHTIIEEIPLYYETMIIILERLKYD